MATAIPGNLAEFRASEVADVLNADRPAGADFLVRGVETDTRRELTGKLFVALRGERFDGHAHVAEAFARGARAAVVERPVGEPGPLFLVPNGLDALAALALAHRRRFQLPVVAIAGAAGKTTTRALTQAVLEVELGRGVHATPGNLNNRVGVPMVLFGLLPEHRAAVLEVGTNRLGEVRALTELVRPDVAVLTLIDLEHTEGLGDLDGVEREESEIFALRPRVAIGNADDPRVRRVLAEAPAERRLLYGFDAASDYRIQELASSRGRSLLRYSTPHGVGSVTVGWLTRPVALAAMAAMAAAESVLGRGVSAEHLATVLSMGHWQPPGRGGMVELADGTLLVDDSYNANPASLRAALGTTTELARERGCAFHLVLGEMRELGTASQAAHREIGRELASLGGASVTAVSGDARYFLAPDAPPSSRPPGFFETSLEAVPHALAAVRPGDVVLVKGSRGTHTEEIARALIESRGGLVTS